jgi:hypothetical protein
LQDSESTAAALPTPDLTTTQCAWTQQIKCDKRYSIIEQPSDTNINLEARQYLRRVCNGKKMGRVGTLVVDVCVLCGHLVGVEPEPLEWIERDQDIADVCL